MLETLYQYARFQYDCGNYTAAAEYLYFVTVLVGNCFIPVSGYKLIVGDKGR